MKTHTFHSFISCLVVIASSFLFAAPAFASTSIAFDAASSNYTGSPGGSGGITTQHNISGSNRILFTSVTVTLGGSGLNADAVTGATYNGTAMTLVGKVATHSGGTNPIETYLFSLMAPAVGPHDVVVSYSGLGGSSRQIFVANASYTGVNQSGLDATSTSADNIYPATSATGTVTTVADNDWVVMGSYSGDGNTSAGSGTTIRATSQTLDRQVLSDSGGPISPAGNVTLTVNNNSDRVGSVTAAIALTQ
jgi:hypothetical protein